MAHDSIGACSGTCPRKMTKSRRWPKNDSKSRLVKKFNQFFFVQNGLDIDEKHFSAKKSKKFSKKIEKFSRSLKKI